MAFDYTGMRATAARLIADFGTTVTLTVEGVGAYDPITDAETVTTTNYVVPATVLPRGADDLSTPFDDIALTDRVKILIAATALPGVVPKPGDKIQIAGDAVAYIISDCKQLRPDGSGIMHTVLAARSGISGT